MFDILKHFGWNVMPCCSGLGALRRTNAPHSSSSGSRAQPLSTNPPASSADLDVDEVDDGDDDDGGDDEDDGGGNNDDDAD